MKNRFNKYKNMLRTVLRKAEMKYFHNKFENNVGNAKNTWKTINEALNRSKSKHRCIPRVINCIEVVRLSLLTKNNTMYNAMQGPGDNQKFSF